MRLPLRLPRLSVPVLLIAVFRQDKPYRRHGGTLRIAAAPCRVCCTFVGDAPPRSRPRATGARLDGLGEFFHALEGVDEAAERADPPVQQEVGRRVEEYLSHLLDRLGLQHVAVSQDVQARASGYLPFLLKPR